MPNGALSGNDLLARVVAQGAKMQAVLAGVDEPETVGRYERPEDAIASARRTVEIAKEGNARIRVHLAAIQAKLAVARPLPRARASTVGRAPRRMVRRRTTATRGSPDREPDPPLAARTSGRRGVVRGRA
jgi:hypothetical protein